MRANKSGRPALKQLKQTIREMRKNGLSFSEIGDRLDMTKQNALYHFKTCPQEGLVKELVKEYT